MTYFLDFDRTLFDIDRALPHIFAHPACVGFSGPPFMELVSKLDALVEEGALSFSKGELSPFLYPDAEEFIRTHECIIVTAGPLGWQTAKVESALPGTSVIYTGDVPKGQFVKDATVSVRGPFSFADDKLEQLQSVKEMNPTIDVFEMRRDGAPGSGKYPVIRSLAELP